ncbi:MAG TPA: iron-containing redox enzyme family protein [Microlunatus sp.]|nr:iron-containing redox enzyme family protein [Microlunatus sp.]
MTTDPGCLSRATLSQLLSCADRALVDGIESDDAQLSLWILYQLHYHGLDGVDDHWEWHPLLVQLAGLLEQPFEARLRQLAGPHLPDHRVAADDLPQALADVIRSADGPSLSSFLAREASREQYAEFVIHRSLYHLIEADPHSWAIPRLRGGPKVALVEIQADEYGAGLPDWMHATLFADTMGDLGLDTGYGDYVDALPAVTLEWMNAMTLFGLHRRLRGAVCGHLSALEMTSSLPNRRYGNGLRRLGLSDARTTRYFDEHVEADAVHEQIAANDLSAELARQHPELIIDILVGAACAVITDARVAGHLLDAWKSGRSSLRTV